ncbi:hypothetical protein FHW20_002114 [Ochrobactrum intermedium]|uniref:Phage tail protein n=1 Tax=Brucella intermedia TaxID=94625 RepID=A0ABR6APA7_9HYPH|nr:pyocin knob domain-containing protein [Brucella intermedia]MBA8851179.1 hypothetical protein [Brucella intermedia]
MATLSDYTSGTITVTQNSVNFTGTNTLWRTAQFREGDTVQLKGYTAIIAAASAADPRIASNTAGTFTEPWPGPSGTFAYRMRFMPDGARVTAQTTTLIELLGNGNLQALAGLAGATKTLPYFTGAGSMDAVAGAANTMPYFTGVNGMAATGLTAFARSLLDDNDAATMLGTLGLTGNAIADMLQDSFGAYSTGAVDLNTLTPGTRGLYANNGGSNFPGSGLWWVETQRMYTGSSAGLRQIATQYPIAGSQDPIIYMRVRSGAGIWGPWRLLTPTYGSNVNGFYIRLPDGTQLCYRAGVAASGFAAIGSVYKSAQIDWLYPAAFSEAPYVDGATNANNAWSAVGTGTATTGNIAFFLPFSFSGSLTCRLVAQGRWY